MLPLGRGRLAQWLSVLFVKIRSPGDRGSNLAEDYFSDANLFCTDVWRKIQLSDELHRILQPIERMAVATISTE